MMGSWEQLELHLADKEPPIPMPDHPYRVTDGGTRIPMGGGMVREPEGERVDFTLIFDGPLVERYAAHMTKGAVKYSPRNWMKIRWGTPEERAKAQERYRRSAFRHFVQWLNGETTEDHAAAVLFNINAYEYLESVK